MWIDDLSPEPDPLATFIIESGLTRSQIDAALQYRASYPDEIATRIAASSPRNGSRRVALKLLLDEMYPAALAEACSCVDINARTWCLTSHWQVTRTPRPLPLPLSDTRWRSPRT